MIALVLCVIGALAAFFLGRRSLGAGLLAVFVFGYFYGILRANIPSTFSHFVFDATLVGLYASQFFHGRKKQPQPNHQALNFWTIILMGWPLLLVVLPFQPFLVSLVGLRGNMFLLPGILLGARLRDEDLRKLAFGFAVLNLVALGFGVAEYLRGIEPFFPPGPMTSTIYNSVDSGGGHRIPAIFQNAHAYAGVMVSTLPILFGAWELQAIARWRKILFLLGMGAALVGVLMASTRLGMIAAGALAVIASLSGRLGPTKRVIWILAIAAVVWSAMHNERWQRYKELDTDTVQDRVAGSVNRTFWEVLVEYPMGNGLGGGGTSIPYFLASQVNRPIEVESEYCRILLEQGWIGLLIWIGFVGWFVTNRVAFVKDEWLTGRRLAWYSCVLSFLIGTIGIGMLSSIPNSFIFLLFVGWTSVSPMRVPSAAPRPVVRPARIPVSIEARA